MKFTSRVMNLNFKNALAYLTFKEIEKYTFISHAFSTRLGGVSKNEYKSMNLGYKDKAEAENTEENYNIFCEALGYDKSLMVRSKQIHGTNIEVITEKNISENKMRFDDADGFVTNVPGVVLKTLHADCGSIYMIDPKNRVIGIAHAGWRGTVKKISKKLLEKFIDVYGSNPEDVVCALGPCIGSCCFEVGRDVAGEFKKLNLNGDYIKPGKEKDKFNIDLQKVNAEILQDSGILPQNIIFCDICSCCNKDWLFSHRATGGKRGNNAACISIIK